MTHSILTLPGTERTIGIRTNPPTVAGFCVFGDFSMRKLLLAATALIALAAVTPANADIIRPLGGLNWTIDASATLLDFSQAQPPGNQPQNNPCIICGANQPNQTNTALGFGYTDYGNQGNQTSETYFSSGILRDTVLASDTISAVNYSGQQLIDVVLALGGQQSFSIGIDVNNTNDPQRLESFFFLNLTQHTILAAFSPEPGGVALPSIHNGTGYADYLLSGLTLNGVNAGDQLAFYARISGAIDGPDSFFLNANVSAVPLPAGVWLFGTAIAGLGALKIRRRRRNNSIPASAA